MTKKAVFLLVALLLTLPCFGTGTAWAQMPLANETWADEQASAEVADNDFNSIADGGWFRSWGDRSAGLKLGVRSIFTMANDISSTTNGQDAYGFWIFGGSILTAESRLKIRTEGARSHGLYFEEDDDQMTLRVGNDLEVVTLGDRAYGVYIRASSDTIIGDGAQITTSGRLSYGLYLQGNDGSATIPTLVIGDRLAIKTTENNAKALFVAGDSEITIGNKAAIHTAGDKAEGIFARQNGDRAFISVGEDLEIVTTGSESHGIYLAQGATNNTVGQNAAIKTSGDAAHAVWVYANAAIDLEDGLKIGVGGPRSRGLYAERTSSIEVGDNAEITLTGAETIGAHAAADSRITIGSGTTIQANGGDAKGLFSEETGSLITVDTGSLIRAMGTAVTAKSGGAVTLEHGTHTIFSPGYALHAYDNGDGKGSRIQASGTLTIIGDIVPEGAGNIIDITYDTGSTFRGAAIEASGRDKTGGKGTINMIMDGTVWSMTASSNLTSLTATDTTILFEPTAGTTGARAAVPPAPFQPMTLSVGTLSGTATTFVMNAEDQLVVAEPGGAKGDFKLLIRNDGAADLNQIARHAYVTMLNDSPAVTALAAGDTVGVDGPLFALAAPTEMGGYLHELYQENGEWKIRDTGILGDPGRAFLGFVEARQILGLREVETLLQRLGDLRDSPYSHGVWAKLHGGQLRSTSHHTGAGRSDTNYYGIQFGYDYNPHWFENGNLYIGIGGGYTRAGVNQTVSETDVDRATVSAYTTYVADGGTYADLVLRYAHSWMDIDAHDSQGNAITASGETDSVDVSLEIGHRLTLGWIGLESLYLEPQVQGTLARQGGDTVRFSNGLVGRARSYDAFIGRAGLNVGHQVKTGDMPYTIYAKASFHKEYADDLKVRFNNGTDKMDMGETWWSYGLGGSVQLDATRSLYADVEGVSGGKIAHAGWKVNAGFRQAF